MGFLRLFLALCVIAGHAGTTVFGFLGIGAWYAVNLFFIISGFYMAMVLNEKYHDTPVNVFYKSRALRLYPIYFVGLAAFLVTSGDFFYTQVYQQLDTFYKIFFVLQNIFIIGQDISSVICSKTITGQCINPVVMTINPPAWSLSVELLFYIVAPFILKSPKRTVLFFFYGVLYLIACTYIKFPVDASHFENSTYKSFYYFFYPSSFVYFAAGALSYHFSKGSFTPKYCIMLVAILLSSLTFTEMPMWHMFFISASIPLIFGITKHNKLDRIIGEISFPAYIIHIPILVFLRGKVDIWKPIFEHVSLGTITALITCIVGIALHFTIEKAIDKFRHNNLKQKPNGVVYKLVKFIVMPVIFSIPVVFLVHILA